MTTPEPLWTEGDMVNEMKAGLTLLTISRPVKIGDFVDRAMAWTKRMRATYEGERAAHLARIAELEAQLISVSRELTSTSNREPSGCRYYRGFNDGFAHAESRIAELERELVSRGEAGA